jgi:Tfp pilus assembly protein PilO
MTKIQQWAVLAVVAVLVIVGAGWFLVISPQKSKAASLRDQASSQQQTNQGVQSQINVLAAQEADVPSEQAQVAAVLQKIPDDAAMPAFIRTLSAAAKTTGVELLTIGANTPTALSVSAAAAPAPVASTAPGATTAPAAAASPLALEGVPLSLSVNGSYFQVQQFLAAIEKFSRTTIVTGVQLAPGAGLAPISTSSAAAPAMPSWTKITANLSVTVFTNGSAADVTAAVASAAAAAASASPAAAPTPSASASASN